MAKLTARQVSTQWNVSRSTVYKKMDRGGLAYETGSDGIKYIDSSEAVRVFGSTVDSPQVSTVDSNPQEITQLRHQLELAETHKKYLLSENNLLKSESAKKDTIISNQRDMLTAFFKRLNPPKKRP